MMKKYISLALLATILVTLSIRLYYGELPLLLSSLLWSLAIIFIYYKCRNSENVNFYRTIFFSVIAGAFLLEMHLFFGNNAEGKGTLAGTATLLPYCHIGMAGNLLHVAYNQFLAFFTGTWGKYGALSIGILWLVVLLATGSAFCSWICFFGGVDNLFCRALPKAVIKLPHTKRFREFQLAVFLFVSFLALLYMEPVFCTWLCPFKINEALGNPNDRMYSAQIIVSFAVIALILVLIPVLSKKRFFCSTTCPFGALPALLQKISPYKLKIDSLKCVRCGQCFSKCPSFAVDKTGEEYSINKYCNLCYACVET
jgi:ferredoxin-type protein NapH